MRRYVADETGVYHFLTDTRVADADGRIVLERAEMRTMQRDHDEIMRAFDPSGTRLHGEEWDYEDILAVLAEPRIQNAENWEQVHRSLARVGMRYVVTGTTARVEFHEARGSLTRGRSRRSAVYANAALGKLERAVRSRSSTPPPGGPVDPSLHRSALRAAQGRFRRQGGASSRRVRKPRSLERGSSRMRHIPPQGS